MFITIEIGLSEATVNAKPNFIFFLLFLWNSTRAYVGPKFIAIVTDNQKSS